MEARYRPPGGPNPQARLPPPQGTNPPAVIGKAAVPVLVGAASLALSAGWKLLQGVLTRPAAQPPSVQAKSAPLVPARGRMSITIRTSWAVGDSSGRWEKGQSEQTIEFGE